MRFRIGQCCNCDDLCCRKYEPEIIFAGPYIGDTYSQIQSLGEKYKNQGTRAGGFSLSDGLYKTVCKKNDPSDRSVEKIYPENIIENICTAENIGISWYIPRLIGYKQVTINSIINDFETFLADREAYASQDDYISYNWLCEIVLCEYYSRSPFYLPVNAPAYQNCRWNNFSWIEFRAWPFRSNLTPPLNKVSRYDTGVQYKHLTVFIASIEIINNVPAVIFPKVIDIPRITEPELSCNPIEIMRTYPRGNVSGDISWNKSVKETRQNRHGEYLGAVYILDNINIVNHSDPPPESLFREELNNCTDLFDINISGGGIGFSYPIINGFERFDWSEVGYTSGLGGAYGDHYGLIFYFTKKNATAALIGEWFHFDSIEINVSVKIDRWNGMEERGITFEEIDAACDKVLEDIKKCVNGSLRTYPAPGIYTADWTFTATSKVPLYEICECAGSVTDNGALQTLSAGLNTLSNFSSGCRYSTWTGTAWLKNVSCSAVQCSCPDGPALGIYSSSVRMNDDKLEVRSKYCNAQYCSHYTQ